MIPFIYPKARHARKYAPKQYKRYQTYKRILRLEFAGKCVYCHLPSLMRGYETFGVDHYRPKKHFAHLSTTYDNLYYCCSTCNSAKGSYWPTTAALEKTHFIPNPCDHAMFEHLRFKGAVVEARSTAGGVALKILDLNDPASIEFREFVLATVQTWEDKKAQLLSKREKAAKKLKAGAMSVQIASAAMAELDVEVAKADKWLKILSGDPT